MNIFPWAFSRLDLAQISQVPVCPPCVWRNLHLYSDLFVTYPDPRGGPYWISLHHGQWKIRQCTNLRFSSSHSTSGSCTNASSTLINESLLSRRSCNVTSQEIRKTPGYFVIIQNSDRRLGWDEPSTPLTPRPSMMFWVSLKGTRSGVSSVLPYVMSEAVTVSKKMTT